MAAANQVRRPGNVKRIAAAELAREIKLVSAINDRLRYPDDFSPDHVHLVELLAGGKDLRDAGIEMGGRMPRELWPLLLDLV